MFEIIGQAPEVIYFAASQPDAAEVDEDCILDCFPGRVSLLVDGDEIIVLDDAPIIGLCSNLSFALKQIRTSPMVSISDVEGSFCLELREKSHVISCEEAHSHTKVDVPSESFITAVHRWVDEMLSAVEEGFPRLLLNGFYRELKEELERDWRDLLPCDADSRYSPTAAWRFMTTTFSLEGELDRSNDGTSASSDVSKLSLTELLAAFLGTVVMIVDGESTIQLEKAPLLLLIGMFPRTLFRTQGSTRGWIKDESGHLDLDLQDLAGVLTCTDRVSGRKVRVLSAMFRHGVRTWSAQLLSTLETRFPTLLQNSIYLRLKAEIAEDWAKLRP